MALTQGQKAVVTRAQSLGGGGQAVALSDEACAYLVGVIVRDLGLQDRFPEIVYRTDSQKYRKRCPSSSVPVRLSRLEFAAVPFLAMFERLVGLDADSDVYFACLAALHKARLKYERILETQAVPTIDQVGPRGLLQYGGMSPKTLAGFLLWRKWIFDIDNRAGQETGYLFEPIIAAAVGGVPASAKRSPIKRRKDNKKGRQVDCLSEKRAYEIKLRMTIAASGQGRWGEELDFPEDCRQSGYVPVLVVLDPTPSQKLTELRAAFLSAAGEVYVGQEAWAHLEGLAGSTMARFLGRYVHAPPPSSEHCVVVALGIGVDGTKHALGLWEGSTENATVCQSLLANLQSRGLRTDRSILVMLDRSKALRAAVTAVFGRAALVQRCQIHKTRNILDHLPERQRPWVLAILKRAYQSEDVKTATRLLRHLARRLDQEHPCAAASVREGLDRGDGDRADAWHLAASPALAGHDQRRREPHQQDPPRQTQREALAGRPDDVALGRRRRPRSGQGFRRLKGHG